MKKFGNLLKSGSALLPGVRVFRPKRGLDCGEIHRAFRETAGSHPEIMLCDEFTTNFWTLPPRIVEPRGAWKNPCSARFSAGQLVEIYIFHTVGSSPSETGCAESKSDTAQLAPPPYFPLDICSSHWFIAGQAECSFT